MASGSVDHVPMTSRAPWSFFQPPSHGVFILVGHHDSYGLNEIKIVEMLRGAGTLICSTYEVAK